MLPCEQVKSSAKNSSLTTAQMFFPRLSNSSMNFCIWSFGCHRYAWGQVQECLQRSLKSAHGCFHTQVKQWPQFSSFCPGMIQNHKILCEGKLSFSVLAELLGVFHISQWHGSQLLTAFLCVLLLQDIDFPGLPIVDYFIPTVWKTAPEVLPMAVIVLEHSLCGWVITVYWSCRWLAYKQNNSYEKTYRMWISNLRKTENLFFTLSCDQSNQTFNIPVQDYPQLSLFHCILYEMKKVEYLFKEVVWFNKLM